jgi:hypothetical protein
MRLVEMHFLGKAGSTDDAGADGTVNCKFFRPMVLFRCGFRLLE